MGLYFEIRPTGSGAALSSALPRLRCFVSVHLPATEREAPKQAPKVKRAGLGHRLEPLGLITGYRSVWGPVPVGVEGVPAWCLGGVTSF